MMDVNTAFWFFSMEIISPDLRPIFGPQLATKTLYSRTTTILNIISTCFKDKVKVSTVCIHGYRILTLQK
jgi:hypothetical protein